MLKFFNACKYDDIPEIEKKQIKKNLKQIYTELTQYTSLETNKYITKKEIYVLKKNLKLSGILMLWTKKVHTQSLYLSITVFNESDFDNIFDLLYEKALDYQNIINLRFQTAYSAKFKKYLNKFKEKGFKTVMHTFDGLAEISSNLYRIKPNHSNSFKVFTYNQIDTKETETKIVNILKNEYVNNHSHNPVDIGDPLWIHGSISNGAIKHLSYYIKYNNEIVGILQSEKGLVKKNIFLGTFYAKREHKKLIKKLLLDRFFTDINSSKFKYIEYEIDDVNKQSIDIGRTLGLDMNMENAFLTLQKEF